MNILITGNLGYVGPLVTRRLRACFPDATLTGLDMGYFAHCLTNAPALPETALDAQVFADVRRPVPPRLLEGTDAIIHLAAISNDPMGKAYEDVTLDINYRAGLDLARAAKAAGVSAFVFASSCSVYGFAEGGPRNEQSAVNPLTAYARSKVQTEEQLRELAGPQFRTTCLRFATACGMSPRLRLDLVLNDFVAAAIATGQITVLSDGSPWRPLINVQDMARAIEWAVTRRIEAGGAHLVINAGSDGWNYQVRDLAAAVAAAIPGTRVSINQDAPPDKRSYQVDFSLFRTLAPSHTPAVGLEQTVEDLREGLTAMRFANAEFRNSSYMRLNVLKDFESRGLLNERLEWVRSSNDDPARAANPVAATASA